jgi:hypothetical protein
MAIAGIKLQLSYGATTGSVYDSPSRQDLWAALDACEREAKVRRMFEWKEPRKRIQVSTVQMIRRYENRFTGLKFPVGGPKK